MNDLKYFLKMIKPFNDNDCPPYIVEKRENKTIVKLLTDDDYCSVFMHFDKDGKFKGFY